MAEKIAQIVPLIQSTDCDVDWEDIPVKAYTK